MVVGLAAGVVALALVTCRSGALSTAHADGPCQAARKGTHWCRNHEFGCEDRELQAWGQHMVLRKPVVRVLHSKRDGECVQPRRKQLEQDVCTGPSVAACCAYSCSAHVRPCAQGRCGRCPPGSGVMSDVFCVYLLCMLAVSVLRSCRLQGPVRIRLVDSCRCHAHCVRQVGPAAPQQRLRRGMRTISGIECGWPWCYTEKAPNAWQRRGTQKTRNTYNQPNRPNRQNGAVQHGYMHGVHA